MSKQKYYIVSTIIEIVTILSMVFMISALKVDATELKTIDFNNIDSRTCRNEISDLILDVLKQDEAYLRSKSQYFSGNTLEEIVEYSLEDSIGSKIITEFVVDYTTPSYSSTGDTVIMANTKLQYNSYNKLYLFEFHVNKEGKIYGYNVWQY